MCAGPVGVEARHGVMGVVAFCVKRGFTHLYGGLHLLKNWGRSTRDGLEPAPPLSSPVRYPGPPTLAYTLPCITP